MKINRAVLDPVRASYERVGHKPVDEHPQRPGSPVSHPSHYNQYEIETINAIKGQSTPDEYRGYLKGNIMKYLARYRTKNGTEDLRKASWYLDRLTAFEAQQEAPAKNWED